MFRLILLLIILVAISAGFVAQLHGDLDLIQTDLLNVFEKHSNIEGVLNSAISTPEPLRGPQEPKDVVLTANGVFQGTNNERTKAGKPTLTRSAVLNQAATNKAKDILARQYFDHVSPTGKGPGDVVDEVGYRYITVGENLALGNFDSDADLVQAWMDSPGHRANILSGAFTELGVAVVEGTYEGQKTWVGVQTFGTPASLCDAPDEATQKLIDTNEAKLDSLQKSLNTQKPAITSSQIDEKSTRGNELINEGNALIQAGNELAQSGDAESAQKKWDEGESRQAEGQKLVQEAKSLQNQLQGKQDAYNNLVDSYNALLKSTQNLITSYNQEIKNFNICAEKYTSAAEAH